LEPFCADVISRLQRQIAESLAPRCLAEDLHAANYLVFTIILAAGLGFSLLLGVILVPLTIRATLTQDFVPAFNLRGSSGSWKEILLSTLFLMMTGMIFAFADMLVSCVGMYPRLS